MATADFLLNPITWDLMLGGSGDIAVCTSDYAIAQNASNAIKLFLGEYYFDTTQGQNWFGNTLALMPPLELVKAQAVAAAETCTGVASAEVFFATFTKRSLAGQVQITTTSGTTVTASFSVSANS